MALSGIFCAVRSSCCWRSSLCSRFLLHTSRRSGRDLRPDRALVFSSALCEIRNEEREAQEQLCIPSFLGQIDPLEDAFDGEGEAILVIQLAGEEGKSIAACSSSGPSSAPEMTRDSASTQKMARSNRSGSSLASK